MKKMTVSVIIPAYNEENYLEACLLSLKKQTAALEEVIVVDDGSTDRTVEIMAELKNKQGWQDLRLIKQAHLGMAKGRNRGAAIAKGEIQVHLDADMTYDEEFIGELIGPIVEGREIATFSRSEYVANLDNRWANYWDRVTFNRKGKRIQKGQSKRGVSFRAIRSEVFREAGGYDDNGRADSDLSVLLKLKETALSVDTAVCYHHNPSSLGEVFLSARWYGRDKRIQNDWRKWLVFSPGWSLVKAVVIVWRDRDWRYGVFRLVFDAGLWSGMWDQRLRGVGWK